jgi:hypothetical protein
MTAVMLFRRLATVVRRASVPGLPATPITDMQISVAELEPLDVVAAPHAVQHQMINSARLTFNRSGRFTVVHHHRHGAASPFRC